MARDLTPTPLATALQAAADAAGVDRSRLFLTGTKHGPQARAAAGAGLVLAGYVRKDVAEHVGLHPVQLAPSQLTRNGVKGAWIAAAARALGVADSAVAAAGLGLGEEPAASATRGPAAALAEQRAITAAKAPRPEADLPPGVRRAIVVRAYFLGLSGVRRGLTVQLVGQPYQVALDLAAGAEEPEQGAEVLVTDASGRWALYLAEPVGGA